MKKRLRLAEMDKLRKILDRLDNWRWLDAVDERISPEELEIINQARELIGDVLCRRVPNGGGV